MMVWDHTTFAKNFFELLSQPLYSRLMQLMKRTFVETVESLSTSTARGFSVVLLLGLRSGPVSNAAELITLAVGSIWDVTELFWENI